MVYNRGNLEQWRFKACLADRRIVVLGCLPSLTDSLHVDFYWYGRWVQHRHYLTRRLDVGNLDRGTVMG